MSLLRPENSEQAKNLRRDRVSSVLCKKGRVCSGTPPCPCWDVEVREGPKGPSLSIDLDGRRA